VVIEQTLSGVHTGKWQGVQPTRKSFEIAVCTIYTFSSEGKLASEDVYFDSSLIYRQLGLSELPNLRSSGPPPTSAELQR
jgi:predicted ester cyclase